MQEVRGSSPLSSTPNLRLVYTQTNNSHKHKLSLNKPLEQLAGFPAISSVRRHFLRVRVAATAFSKLKSKPRHIFELQFRSPPESPHSQGLYPNDTPLRGGSASQRVCKRMRKASVMTIHPPLDLEADIRDP